MPTFNIPLGAMIVVLLPMLYFLRAAPSFLLVKLVDPAVTRLLRGMFAVQFGLVGASCATGALTFALHGRPVFAAAVALVAALALGARRWFLRHLDAAIRARGAGDRGALRRLRRLHLGGMAYNAAQFVALVACIPLVFGAAA